MADDGSDWASYERLELAVNIGMRDPDVALERLRPFVDFEMVSAFVLSRSATEYSWGTSQWQEVAVTDGRRLIMWHGTDAFCEGCEDRPAHPVFKSSVRTVKLSTLGDQSLRAEYDVEPDGTHRLLDVRLVLLSATVVSTSRVSVTDSDHFVECLKFNKSRDDGTAQMRRLLDFAAAVSSASEFHGAQSKALLSEGEQLSESGR